MSAATEEHVDLGVDLDAEVPCYVEECRQVATWAGICRPCGHQGPPVCEPHMRMFAQQFARAIIEPFVLIRCTTCRELVADCTWRPL